MRGGKRAAPSRSGRLTAYYLLLAAAILMLALAVAGLRQKESLEPESAPAPEDIRAADGAQETPAKPEPEPEPTLAERTLAGMSLREKVFQLFIVYPSALTADSPVTQAGEDTEAALERAPVGGLLLDRSNMVSQEQVRALIDGFQRGAKIPMIVACDEEGGRVARLMRTVGTTSFKAMLSYEAGGPDTARENAETIARDLRSCALNMDFAPVADVWSNPKNEVIGDRAYSRNFEAAAELVSAAVEGFHQGGTACTLKHFPGHGDTSADSHFGSVYVYKALDELRTQELLPFQAGIAAGADAVMVGHLIVKDVEDVPAPFSRKLVTELLREELGFSGVVLTDSLQMQAMTEHYSSGEIAVMALQAGVDILLCPMDLSEAADALLHAVERGELSEARIDESVLRILTLKESRGILAPAA